MFASPALEKSLPVSVIIRRNSTNVRISLSLSLSLSLTSTDFQPQKFPRTRKFAGGLLNEDIPGTRPQYRCVKGSGLSFFPEDIQCFMWRLRDRCAERERERERERKDDETAGRGPAFFPCHGRATRGWTAAWLRVLRTLNSRDGPQGRKMTAGIPASDKTMLQICHLNEIVSFTFRGNCLLCKYREACGSSEEKGRFGIGRFGKIDDRISFGKKRLVSCRERNGYGFCAQLREGSRQSHAKKGRYAGKSWGRPDVRVWLVRPDITCSVYLCSTNFCEIIYNRSGGMHWRNCVGIERIFSHDLNAEKAIEVLDVCRIYCTVYYLFVCHWCQF